MNGRRLTSWKLTLASGLAALMLLAACGGTAAPTTGTAAPKGAASAAAGGGASASGAPAASNGSASVSAAAAGKPSAAAGAFGKPETPKIKVVYATASGEDTFVELAKSKGFF